MPFLPKPCAPACSSPLRKKRLLRAAGCAAPGLSRPSSSETDHHRGLGVLELLGESVEILLFLCFDFMFSSSPLLRVRRFVQQNARTHRRSEVHFLDVLAFAVAASL
jgi:hypothetical protein